MRFTKTILILVLLFWAATAYGQTSFTLVIDPGHGGDKPGAVSGKLLEKDINLSVSRKFGKLVEDNLKDVKVVYTRTGDTNPSLAARGELANKIGADLFISIHCNSFTNSTANGSSTFVMGMSISEENLQEAMRENEVIKFEDDYTAVYEGFDPSSAESYIIFQLMQYAHFDHSIAMARIVQKHYTQNTPMRNRGAAQGPYLVLWKTTMPSVLTEIGFISNPTDRAYISSAKGQDVVARSLYDAFYEYKKAVENETIARTAPVSVSTPAVSQTEKPYYVQLFASRSRERRLDAGVVERRIDGWYKYCTGPYATASEAEAALAKARHGRYKDAFITR